MKITMTMTMTITITMTTIKTPNRACFTTIARPSPLSPSPRRPTLQHSRLRRSRKSVQCAKDLFEEEDERSGRRQQLGAAKGPGEELGVFIKETSDRTTLLPFAEAIRILAR